MTADAWWEGPLMALALEADGDDPMTAAPTACAVLEVAPDGTKARGRAGRINPDGGTPVAVAMLGVRDVLAENLRRPAGPLPLIVYDAPFTWCLFLRLADLHGVPMPNGQPIVDPLVIHRGAGGEAQSLEQLAGACGVPVTDPRGPGGRALAAVAAARSIVRRYAERGPAGLELTLPGLHRWQRDLFAAWRGSARRMEVGEWPTGRLALDPKRGYGPQEHTA